MIKKAPLLVLLFLFFSCKSKPINQTIDHKKEGKWASVYVEDSVAYKYIEHYKKDQPVKKWKTYINGKIYKTEKYRNGICIVRNYYENGKLQSKGNTKLEVSETESHWFYFGDWRFYSDKGKLIQLKKYNQGNLISEQEIE